MDMADWAQTFTTIGAFSAFFVYLMVKIDSNKKDTDRKIDSNQKETNGRFEGLNTRFNSLENRMTSMEGEIKNVHQNLGQRIDNTNQRIDGTNQRLTDLKTDINQRLSTIEGYLVPKKIFHFEEPHHDPDEPKEN